MNSVVIFSHGKWDGMGCVSEATKHQMDEDHHIFLFHSVAIPIGSMYGIFIYIHHPSTIHGGKYTSPMDAWRFTKNWQIQFVVGFCLLVKGQDPGLATPQKWSFLAGAFTNSLQIRFWAELHLCNNFASKQRLLIFLAF